MGVPSLAHVAPRTGIPIPMMVGDALLSGGPVSAGKTTAT